MTGTGLRRKATLNWHGVGASTKVMAVTTNVAPLRLEQFGLFEML